MTGKWLNKVLLRDLVQIQNKCSLKDDEIISD
jgi:hypothetical protein